MLFECSDNYKKIKLFSDNSCNRFRECGFMSFMFRFDASQNIHIAFISGFRHVAAFNGCPYGAVRLMAVCAIVEMAGFAMRPHLGKEEGYFIRFEVNHAKLAYAGCVNDIGLVLELDKLGVGGGMFALVGRTTDISGFEMQSG